MTRIIIDLDDRDMARLRLVRKYFGGDDSSATIRAMLVSFSIGLNLEAAVDSTEPTDPASD